MTAEEFSGKVVVVTGGSRGIGRVRTTTDYPRQATLSVLIKVSGRGGIAAALRCTDQFVKRCW